MGAARPRGLRAWASAALLVAAMAVVGCGSGNVASAPDGPEWHAPNADDANTRSRDSAINAANVHRLKLAWSLPIENSYAATPIVVDGVVYTADRESNVYAIDLATGRLRWRRDYAPNATGPNGVSVSEGRVFSTTKETTVALDARTGTELWRTRLIEAPSELIVMTPGYKDGIVYVSTNPTADGDIGTLWAMDARTGRRLWGWRQSPAGATNGSGGLWHPPAFDDRGALYMSIANPVPWPGTPEAPWGRSRPGPNKWSNSIVKLDARSGRFIWGTQALPHDFYDWDLQAPVILAHVDGRAVALTAGKMGIVYEFDAETGRLLWKRPVGLHNGHDDDSLRAMHGDYSNIGYGRRMLPGDQGGVETQMASDGRTVYVPANNLYAVYYEQTLPKMQKLEQGTGEVVALDIATGRVRWVHRFAHGMYGGATITNDLVFTSTYDGTLWALRRDTGEVVWKAQLPAGSISPAAISGDTVLSAGSLVTGNGQHTAIVAYRLARG